MAGSSFSRTRSHYAQTHILQPNHSWIFSTGTDAPDKKLHERDLRRGLESVQVTLDEFLDHWLNTVAKTRLRKKTYRDYEAMLRRYVRPFLGARKIAVLSPVDIQNTYQWMIESGLSSRTVRYVHSVLRCALNQAVRWQLVGITPTSVSQSCVGKYLIFQ